MVNFFAYLSENQTNTGNSRTTKILRLSGDLPIIIEIVDSEEKIDHFLPKLDDMIQERMVTVEGVQIVMYRYNKKENMGAFKKIYKSARSAKHV